MKFSRYIPLYCLSFVLLCYMAYAVQTVLTSRTGESIMGELSKPISPETTIVVFDLHDVVLKRSYPDLIRQSARTLGRGLFVYLVNPLFWHKTVRFMAQNRNLEGVFKKLIFYYPGLAKHKDDFYRLYNAYEPIDSTVDFIKKLHAKGYNLYILSNIGSDIYRSLTVRYPEIFGYFKGVYTPSSSNNYNHKPNLSFYQEFKKYVQAQGDGDKQGIFIDDIYKNIEAAIASNAYEPHGCCNLVGIHYTSEHSINQSLKIFDLLNDAIDAEKQELKS